MAHADHLRCCSGLRLDWEVWKSAMLPERVQPATCFHPGNFVADQYGVVTPRPPRRLACPRTDDCGTRQWRGHISSASGCALAMGAQDYVSWHSFTLGVRGDVHVATTGGWRFPLSTVSPRSMCPEQQATATFAGRANELARARTQ